MSLINDALKQARKAPPPNLPTALPPSLRPVAKDPPQAPAWLWACLVLAIIAAAIFFGGWALAHHTVRTIAADPASGAGRPALPDIPVVQPRPADSPAAPTPPPAPAPSPVVPPPVLPKLQGIFYSATAPSAILEGKTVRPGDQFREFQVKAISKYAVTLVGPDKKVVQIDLGN